MIPLLLGALLSLLAACVVLYPLFRPAPQGDLGGAPGALVGLSEREQAAKDALREVEFDYRLGNLEATDYADLRDRYEERALNALKSRYQRQQELDAQIERQLDAMRVAPTRGSARERADGQSAPTTKTRPAAPATQRARRRRGRSV